MICVETLFDSGTNTLTHIVYSDETKSCVVIDPVLDFDVTTGKIKEENYFKVKDFVLRNDLRLHYVLETHAHADHISSSQLFKRDFSDVKIAIGKGISEVQEVFGPIFNIRTEEFNQNTFDELLDDGEVISLDGLDIKVISTPGHTPACVSYLIGENLFTGDALFMPDSGTGRCDFPKGSAEDLYHSIHEKLYKLDDGVKVFVGHDYQKGGRELCYQTTIGDSKKSNIQLTNETGLDEFVNFRTKRDSVLNAPKLLLPSIQVNIMAGKIPHPDSNGTCYLKLPVSL